MHTLCIPKYVTLSVLPLVLLGTEVPSPTPTSLSDTMSTEGYKWAKIRNN